MSGLTDWTQKIFLFKPSVLSFHGADPPILFCKGFDKLNGRKMENLKKHATALNLSKKGISKSNKRKIDELPHYRIIKTEFYGPTNHLGARIKIWEEPRYYDQDNRSWKAENTVFLSYDYSIGNVLEQSLKFLVKHGFNPICTCAEFNNYYVVVNNWSDEYLSIANLKNK